MCRLCGVERPNSLLAVCVDLGEAALHVFPIWGELSASNESFEGIASVLSGELKWESCLFTLTVVARALGGGLPVSGARCLDLSEEHGTDIRLVPVVES